MTSKSKVVTENTQQLSSEGSIGAKVLPSRPLVSSDNTPVSTEILSKPFDNMLSTEKNVSEKSRQHAALLKVLLSRLEKAGLIRRFKVLSKDGTCKEIQIVFDNSIWTQDLDLLSPASVRREE